MSFEQIMDVTWMILIGFTMLVTAASIILKWIAPKTKTLWDDKAYELLLKVLRILSIAESAVGQVKGKPKK